MTPLWLPGDAILYPEDKELSSEIVAFGEREMRLKAGAQYTHAGIAYLGDNNQFEAIFPRARFSLIDTSRTFEVWRLCDLTDTERNVILEWCRQHDGYFYDLPGVLTGGRVKIPGLIYCSRAVCLAYDMIGKHPGDLIMSPDSLPLYPGARMLYRHTPVREN